MERVRARPRLEIVREAPDAAAPREPALDDVQLLAALRAGDEDAAESLHDRLRPRVALTVRRLLGPGDADEDDCVQIAFVEIVRSVDQYRGESSLEHWASTIAAHVVYKHIRRRKTERRVFEHGARTSDRPAPMSASRRVVVNDLVQRIRERLAGIDSEKIQTFLMHDVLGFDLREIAQITEVSVAAAQQRLVRGRREAHAELAADPELARVLEDMEDQP